MKPVLFGVAALIVAAAPALADTCKATAEAQKLRGAALASYLKKCESDAKASCSSQASEKKLAGAAKTSFTTKCVREAVGQ